MGTLATAETIETSEARWSRSKLVAFRFSFTYFSLYFLTTQVFVGLFPIPSRVALQGLRYLRGKVLGSVVIPPVSWTAAHIFGVKLPLVTASGSGDKTFDWVLLLCSLALAALATAVWSSLDWKHENHDSLYKWFRVVFRFALASQMMTYGASKVIPSQMAFPSLTRFVEPYGNFSPMGVLWESIGASPAYESFAGCAELLGGILLIAPRLTILGAAVCLADMTQAFVLNMTYDVPVKLLSFHLLVMSVILLSPDLPRLANVFLLNREARPAYDPALFHGRRANRIAIAAQIVFGLWMVVFHLWGTSRNWTTSGGGRPKSPLYGIWNVEQFTLDGQTRPALLTDDQRWRRAIFEFPNNMSFQRMDDSFTGFNTAIDAQNNTLALTKAADKSWRANFAFERKSPEQLILDGAMDGHKVRMQLQLVRRDSFPLVNRGFHWVQEFPFIR